ncbi:hypothetical protein C8J57DRAFT_1483199 [Mycena rebaudengoi]|nr:hypothetical protein C8J57DRAFT_1483199 [Mycena rebaudengoi]
MTTEFQCASDRAVDEGEGAETRDQNIPAQLRMYHVEERRVLFPSFPNMDGKGDNGASAVSIVQWRTRPQRRCRKEKQVGQQSLSGTNPSHRDGGEDVAEGDRYVELDPSRRGEIVKTQTFDVPVRSPEDFEDFCAAGQVLQLNHETRQRVKGAG